MRPFLRILLAFLAVCLPSHAIDPGTAQGALQVGAESVPFRHAYALLHDNAEGLLDRPKELRIAIVDREVPQESLGGIAFLAIEQLAREGKVRGILLRFDPANRRNVVVTLLERPTDARRSLVSQTVRRSGAEVVKNFAMANNRVRGDLDEKDGRGGSDDLSKLDYRVQFSAPLFNEPGVSADLKGEAAQDSPQVRLLRERARAFAKADFDTVKKLSSARSAGRLAAFLAQAGTQAKTYAKEAGADMEKSLKGVQRVVVRGERAVVIFSEKEWSNLVRLSGDWRSDD